MHTGIELAIELAFYSSSRCKTTKMFKGFYPLNPHQGSAMNPLQNLQQLETPTCILQHWKSQS